MNKALNSTLSRTLNTSLTTLIVLLAIFIFGGESIRGFMFALIVGVIVGTYSSVFIATPIMFDTQKKRKRIKGSKELSLFLIVSQHLLFIVKKSQRVKHSLKLFFYLKTF